jgi:deoxyribodipyrimidine photo-lyase
VPERQLEIGREVTRGLHWFRNDLRLRKALAAQAAEWLPVFVLDPRILAGSGVGEARMRFLLDCLGRLSRDLEKRGVPLLVRKGRPEAVLPKLLRETGARLLSFNEDTTPFARRRDAAVQQAVERGGGQVLARLDHVVFQSSEVRSKSGGAYSVYSPYRNTWWRQWNQGGSSASGPECATSRPAERRPPSGGSTASWKPQPGVITRIATDPTAMERRVSRRTSASA